MEFPFPPLTFEGKSYKAEIGASFQWLKQGWYIFLAKSSLWISCSFIVILLLLLIALIPVFGMFLVCVCLPFLAVGLFEICIKVSKDDGDEIAYNLNNLSVLNLFIGFNFNEKNKQLLLLATAFAISILIIILCALFILQSSSIIEEHTTINHILNIKLKFGKLLLVFFTSLLLSIPILLVMWFAPLLIFIHQKTCLDAIKISFIASIKNILPAFIFNIFIAILFCLSVLTCGLGFLILIPVLFGAIYASYKDIFFEV